MSDELMSFADRTGQELFRVLREACRQMKEWQGRLAQPQLEIGVNLSSRQFQGPGLVAEVAEVLREPIEKAQDANRMADKMIDISSRQLRGLLEPVTGKAQK